MRRSTIGRRPATTLGKPRAPRARQPNRRAAGSTLNLSASAEEHGRSDVCANPRYAQGPCKLLGRGGNAETFQCYDSETGQSVAVKRLTLRSMSSWKQLELFEREAETLKGLDNPGVPAYLDYFEEEGERDKRFYIVQQLAAGRTLQAMVKGGRRFTDEELRYVLVKLLETIVYLGSLRPPVVHRDIKPANIVVSNPGDDDGVMGASVMLVDFGGVAAAADQENRMNTMTIVGTLDFMAPEQYRGRTSPLSDVYSAAATILYVSTRRLPSQFDEVRMRIDLREVEMDVTLKRVLEGMLEPAIEDRLDARRALAVLTGSSSSSVGTPSLGGSRWSRGDAIGLAEGALPRKKPVGSRVELVEGDSFLRITIPPGKFDAAAVSVGGFALAWNAFVAFWTLSALAGGGIVMALFSTPFWFAGWSLAKTSVSRQFMSEEIYLDKVSWRVTKRLALFKGGKPDFDDSESATKRQVGFIDDLAPAQLKVNGFVNDVPQTSICIPVGAETLVVGEGLTEVEQVWLVGKINAWLSSVT